MIEGVIITVVGLVILAVCIDMIINEYLDRKDEDDDISE